MVGYAQHIGRLPEQIHFVYLKEEKKHSRDPSDEMYEAMVSKAQSLMTAIEAEQLPARPGDPCYWCDHEVHCGASPVGAGGVNWRDYP